MKKAILCFPFVSSRQPQYPTGLYKIASFCRDSYEIIVIDQRIDLDVTQRISDLIAEDPGILCLGLSVMTGEQIKQAVEISKIFHGRLPIVWGGIHPTILPKQTLESEFIDYIIIGEGEEAFLSLLNYLSGTESSPQLFLSRNSPNYTYNYVADLNACGYIDFSRFEIKPAYFIKRDGFDKAFAIETSRGCPFCCSFCHNSIFRKPYRAMSEERVLAVANDLYRLHRLDGIIFQEDNFFADIKRVKRIIRGLLQEGSAGWKANSRINYFYALAANKPFMDDLLQSRCMVLQFGIESGSPTTIARINKKIDIERVVQTNKNLSAYPIRIRYNFIVGFPGETEGDIVATLRLIDTLCRDNPRAEPPFLNIYSPYPGTPLYEDAIRHGFKEPNDLLQWSDLNWSRTWLDCFPGKLRQLIETRAAQFLSNSLYLRGN